ncbi:MAG: HAMP domain-containing sensor histidine kinase [Candidatus Lernaella stagnicola]|nr:HAMP domain-containing sensor histidine kinase [Candidatus Lernaella stagnicola]
MEFTRAAVGKWFTGLEDVGHRGPTLGLMTGRFVNLIAAAIFWMVSWNFAPPRPYLLLAIYGFGLVGVAYVLLLPRVYLWRFPIATTLDLLFLDLAAITSVTVNTGGLSSPFLCIFLFPLLAAYFYDNRRLIDLTVGGVAASLLIVAAAHRFFMPAALTGPALPISDVWAWQVPFLFVLLTLAFFINRRSADQRREAQTEMGNLQRRLGAANDELTRSFYDLEAALDRGRANQDYAQHARRQLLRAERFSATGKLVAGILHDMTNPLSIIISDSELFFLKFEDRLDKARTTLQRVLQNAQHMSLLIDNLRLLTKQRGDAVHSPIDMRHLIMRCLRALEPERKRRGVVVDSILDENTPGLLGIESQLEQMIVDLLVNAFEAIHRPGGRVTIRTRQEEDTLVLEVEDDGEGIAAEYLPQIFEPFFSTRGTPSSLGLGLFSVRTIVEEHGGVVSVRSKLDAGTTFIIRLPFEPTRRKKKTS